MNIRKANDKDMDSIMSLVDNVFEGEQNIPRKFNPISEEKLPTWYCVENENEVVGAAVVFKEDGEWHMGRIAISPKMRGQHIGTKMLKFILEDVFNQNTDRVYLDARDTTVHIMKQFGAKIIGATTVFYNDNITPIVIEKETFKKAVIR